MVEFIFKLIVFALGVYYGSPIAHILEFVLHCELNLNLDNQNRNKYLVAFCLSVAPTACFYGAFVGDNYLLVCFVALAGYLVSFQDDLISTAAEEHAELVEASKKDCNEYLEALDLFQATLKREVKSHKFSINVLTFDRKHKEAEIDNLRREVEELNGLLSEQRSHLREASLREEEYLREIKELQNLVAYDETDTMLPLKYKAQLIGPPRKSHRNGTKGKTLRTHRNG